MEGTYEQNWNTVFCDERKKGPKFFELYLPNELQWQSYLLK
jgi:hypothetical protein